MKTLSTIFILFCTFNTYASDKIKVGVTKSNFDAASMCGCEYQIKGKKGLVFIPELKNDKYRAAMNLNDSEVILERKESKVSKCEKPYSANYCSSETYINSNFHVNIQQLKSKSLCGNDRECEASENVSEFTIKTSTDALTFIGVGICAC